MRRGGAVKLTPPWNPPGVLSSVAARIGYRFYFDKPSGGPDQGIRLSIVALFPR
jgi:hypothetical protein